MTDSVSEGMFEGVCVRLLEGVLENLSEDVRW